MAATFKDLYVMAYLFARRLDPNRGFDGAAQYGKQMCVLLAFFYALLVVQITEAALHVRPKDITGESRVPGIIVTLVFLFGGYALAGKILRRRPELESPEWIADHNRTLSRKRKIMVLSVPALALAGNLLIPTLRSLFGWFGGI